MKKVISFVLLLTFLIVPWGNVKGSSELHIYEEDLTAQNHNTYSDIYWTTNKQANCNVVYGETSNLVNTSGEGNDMSGFGQQIGDVIGGKYTYFKKIDISNNDKYYRILCVDNDGITKDTEIYSLLSDLTILNVELPQQAFVGDSVLAKVTIRNNGQSGAVDYDLRITHLGGSLLSADDSPHYLLSSGETLEYSMYLKYTTSGSYTIKAEIDSGGNINETNEDNNLAYATINIIDKKPDLIIQDVSFSPSTPSYFGEKFSGQIKVKVKNIGNVSALNGAKNNWIDLIRVSVSLTNNWVLLDSLPLDYKSLEDIAPGETKEVVFDVNNLKIDSGTLELRVWVDSNAVIGDDYDGSGNHNLDLKNDNLNINESDEDNNTYHTIYVLISNPKNKKPQAKNLPTTPTAKRLKGRLLLGVQQGGAVWYVDDINYERHQINWDNAMPIFQKFALGISDEDLLKIPVAMDTIREWLDSDGDGYSDRTELKNGYSPYTPAMYGKRFQIDQNLANRLKGKLLLRVSSGGSIWYVDENGFRHSVRWDNLRQVFENLALGINNADLEKIGSGD